jgi:hypothetical protein
MLVLIDESGDCGLKFDKGSSDLLVCVAVVFSSSFAASACDRAIDCLRRECGKSMSFEFHFSHCSDKIRKAFLKTVSHEDFRYAGFVVDKRKLYGARFSKPKEVYEFAVSMVCENVRILLDESKIIIDKSGDRDFRKKLAKTLKDQMTDRDGTCRIKKVAMEGSHTNNLLQLADMVCGAVNRSHSGSDHFRDLIRSKEKFVQRWPN